MFIGKVGRNSVGVVALAFLFTVSVFVPPLYPQESVGMSPHAPMHSLFWALNNQTPIAAFASRGKAMVNPEGSIQQVLYSEPAAFGKERVNGPLLKWDLLAHSADVAQITQRYTDALAPTVETTLLWPDAKLVLTAFAAEPKQDGYYLRAELVNRGKREEEFRLEFTLANASSRLVEDTGLVDAEGRVLLQVMPVSEGSKFASWEGVSTPRPGLRFAFLLKPFERSSVAVAMPIGGKRSSPSSFEADHRATGLAWQPHLEGGVRLTVPEERIQLAWESNRKQVGLFLEPQADGLRILAGLGVYHFSCPYTTLQASLALDELGYPDTAEALLRRQLKHVRTDGIFEISTVPRKSEQFVVTT